MNALAQPVTVTPPGTSVPLLRTLVLCDLVDSTALVERLGDRRGAELLRRHDRLARALISAHGGREIDKTDGFLLMFERPVQAVAFALAYLRALRELNAQEGTSLAVRVGIHVGDILSWDNSPDDIAKGAKPIEVEGLVKPITSRLMQLALPNQILLSGVAHALAHRAQGELGAQLEQVRWRTHGRYRFKGIPDPIPVFEVGEEDIAPLKAPPWSGKAHREVPFWRRPATLGIELAVLFVLLAVPAWYLLKPEPAIAFAQRDWVVVGDLKNLTGETAFDDSIETAFRIGLEQSRHVNVLSDLKTRETIKRMQRDPDSTEVDRTIGSEIAIRDGARALILPTIAEIGGRVRITAEVVDPHTHTTVYSESADGVGGGSVLPSLDQVNQKLRVRLGEALATVSRESMPLEKVATPNLDALRAYTLAEKAYAAGRKGAIPMYEQALRLDPGFALAHIGLARTLFSADQNGAAREQIRLASVSRERLSPRDALYVEAWQATFGPPVPALEKWSTFALLYPDFFPAAGTYGYFAWQYANRFEDAIAALEKVATERNPNRGVSDYNLGMLYLGQERVADALNSFARADSLGAAQQKNYYAAAYAVQRQFDKAAQVRSSGAPSGNPGEDIDAYVTQLAFDADAGNWSALAATHAQATRDATGLGARKTRQFGLIKLSLDAVVGQGGTESDALRAYLQGEFAHLRSKDDVDHADTVFQVLFAGYLAAAANDPVLASTALGAEMPEARDGQYPILAQLLKVVEAESARSRGEAGRAVALLKPLVNGTELFIVHVALMDAHAANGQSEAAATEAAWLAAHRGRAYAEANVQRILTPFNVAQTNLALLREAELRLALDDRGAAAKSLAKFEAAWPTRHPTARIAERAAVVRAALAVDARAVP
jgi:putative peptide modification system cyclase